MMRPVLLAVLALVVFFGGALLLVYWQTRVSGSTAAIAVEPAIPAEAPAPPVQPDPLVALPAPIPEVPERRVAIPAGPLQARLESQDPEERTGALLDARDQRRTRMMDWLNRTSSRRAAAAAAAARAAPPRSEAPGGPASEAPEAPAEAPAPP